ncbi:36591_t:CDS:1, partial [Racocetra persica]
MEEPSEGKPIRAKDRSKEATKPEHYRSETQHLELLIVSRENLISNIITNEYRKNVLKQLT